MLCAVIGLGVFGRSAALELQRMGNTVIGIDVDNKEIEKVSNILPYTAIADTTNKEILAELNLTKADVVLVSIGDYIEASILTVVNLKKLGVQNIWVKAKSEAHNTILTALGVKHIIRPEREMGIRIAQAMNYPVVADHMALGNELYLIQVIANDNLQGKTIKQALDEYESISTVLVKRGNKILNSSDEELNIANGDQIVLVGGLEALKNLSRDFKIIERKSAEEE